VFAVRREPVEQAAGELGVDRAAAGEHVAEGTQQRSGRDVAQQDRARPRVHHLDHIARGDMIQQHDRPRRRPAFERLSQRSQLAVVRQAHHDNVRHSNLARLAERTRVDNLRRDLERLAVALEHIADATPHQL